MSRFDICKEIEEIGRFIMVTRSDIKFIHSLKRKSRRDEEGLFLAEGVKAIEELLGYFHCRCLIGTSEMLSKVESEKAERIEEVDEKFPFAKISILESPRRLLAVFEQPDSMHYETFPKSGVSLLLDEVQDPGNLGTIIRTAAWFGCRRIYLTVGSADPYSPKVVQSTMGALGQVQLRFVNDAAGFVSSLKEFRVPVYGTSLDGEPLNISALPPLSSPSLIIMGNEGRGVSEEISSLCSHKLLIPSTNPGDHPESLNVAIATAILLSRWFLR